MSENDILELAIESGAVECNSVDNYHEIHCKKDEIYEIKKKMEKKVNNFISTNIEWIPNNFVIVPKEIKNDVIKFLELLDDEEDVQNIFTNVKFME